MNIKMYNILPIFLQSKLDCKNLNVCWWKWTLTKLSEHSNQKVCIFRRLLVYKQSPGGVLRKSCSGYLFKINGKTYFKLKPSFKVAWYHDQDFFSITTSSDHRDFELQISYLRWRCLTHRSITTKSFMVQWVR